LTGQQLLLSGFGPDATTLWCAGASSGDSAALPWLPATW